MAPRRGQPKVALVRSMQGEPCMGSRLGWSVVLSGLVLACSSADDVRDAGTLGDGGAPSDDGGAAPDAGAVSDDGGASIVPAWTIAAPTAPEFDWISLADGLAAGLVDASLDRSGNLWAVTSDRVFVRRVGTGTIERYDTSDGLKPDEILAVGGASAGIAWIGHRGEGDANEDPEWMRATGGVERLELTASGLRATAFELASPPGRYPQYPDGRYKLRSCLRVHAVNEGPFAGDVWFGCNHGAALIQASSGEVFEHHHPAYCEWRPETQSCTLRTGDVPAMAATAEGDVWLGGTYGVMQLDYASPSGSGDFWGPEPVRDLRLWDLPLSPNAHGSVDVVAVAVTPDGTLWAASAHSGLAHRRADGAIEFLQQADGLASNRLVDLCHDGLGALWVATADGTLLRLAPPARLIEPIASLPGRAVRLACVQTDAGPRVIVTTPVGVAVVRPP